jgi:hypothetical protein
VSKKTPGGRHAIKAGRLRYQKEREAHRAKLRRRREAEIASYFHLTPESIEQIDPEAERRAS